MNTPLTLLAGAVAGAVATAAKGRAEGALQPFAERLAPPRPVERTAIGADASGHPENMPPAELADRAVQAVTGSGLDDEQRTKVSPWLHWTTGVGFGVGYALAAQRFAVVRAGRGLAAGAALFTATHGTGLPAAGLQHPPWTMPAAWWVWEAGSHLVYGAALDASLHLVQEAVRGAQ